MTQTTNGGPDRAAIRALLGLCSSPVKPTGDLRKRSTLKRHQVDRRVLASSIDLDVELHTVAFVQALHARTLDRADVHESVRLTVITRDEAETLHGVEELDGASGLLAGQLTLRGSLALFDGDDIADGNEVGRRNLATAIDELEFQLLTFGETFETRAFDRRDVHEHIIATFVALDETEALGRVEELDRAAALADDLCGHAAAATAAAATRAARAARSAAVVETTAAAAAEAVTASEAITPTESVSASETILSREERIEIVLSKPIPLVASPSATTSIKTHVYERTFDAP